MRKNSGGPSMARFFESLGAPLKNIRWSWGAQHSDGSIFLRQWETDVIQEPDGDEYVQIAHRDSPPGSRQHGWRERLAHIAALRGGARCFVVLVAAKDPTVKNKAVKAFDARSVVVGGRLIVRDGRTYVKVLERRPVSDFVSLESSAVSASTDRRTFRAREVKGSRLRCLVATSLSRQNVADFLEKMVAPHAEVTPQDVWQPRGFLEPDEAKLGETLAFLTADQREQLLAWWLRIRGRANLPNWDLVSTCRMEDARAGLILVEAKAHAAELHIGGKAGGGNASNDTQIRSAILEANTALGGAAKGWALSGDCNYQLCNRFAWAWKIASLGVPVVLVFLGFLDADEMPGQILKTPDQWRARVLAYAAATVPESAWESRITVGDAGVVPLIRAGRVFVDTVQ